MAVSGSITLNVAASESKTSGVTVGNALWSGKIAHALSFGNGTTANNFDLLYVAERTVASASNDDLDVAGVLASPLGSTFHAVELVAIVIVIKPESGSNTTNRSIGGGTNYVPGFAAAISTLGPGGLFVLADGDASGIATVTAGTADILRVANSSGASNTYQIAIF